MNKKRIYISGPMTGRKNFNVPAFNDAARRLEAGGWSVVNPVDLSQALAPVSEVDASFAAWRAARTGDTAKWPQARLAQAVMSMDLAAIGACQAIYLLRGWQSSDGARRELRQALKLNLEIILEP